MGDLTNNFSRAEFACKCGCGFDTVDAVLLRALQSCVDSFKTNSGKAVSMIINCGCRCKRHNDSLKSRFVISGGKHGENTAPNSQHIYGRAADLVLLVDRKRVPPKEVSAYFKEHFKELSVGTYASFTHVDSRSGAAKFW